MKSGRENRLKNDRARCGRLLYAGAVLALSALVISLSVRFSPKVLPYTPVDAATIETALLSNGELTPSRQTVVASALSLVGEVRYFWGGKSDAIGFDPRWGTPATVRSKGSGMTGTVRPLGLDCSGYASWCYIQTGASFPEMAKRFGDGTYNQWYKSDPVDIHDLLPGDLLFQYNPSEGKGNHVGIVIGFLPDGEPLIAHCDSGYNDVVVTGRGSIFSYPRRPWVYGR